IIDYIQCIAYVGVDVSPSITYIQQVPGINNVTPFNSVMVNANISSAKGIYLAELHWGVQSGNLPQIIELNLIDNHIYTTGSAIPEQPDGTVVFYQIFAEDNEGNSTLSPEISYQVYDPEGCQFLILTELKLRMPGF